jgi:hypothetical protein
MGYRFTFRLFPEEKSERHTHLVYACLCELFFDLASYPCEIRFTAAGLGYMLTRETMCATNAADCLDEWEEVFDFVQHKNGSCWLYLELTCRAPHRSVKQPTDRPGFLLTDRCEYRISLPL